MAITLSTIIPTEGRETLVRALDSTLYQLREGDEVIIAGDVTHGVLDWTEGVCMEANAKAQSMGARVRYVPYTTGKKTWGHDQINHAMTVARGDYLCFQDDDDIFLAGAFDAMRCDADAQPSPRPLLYRFLTHYGLTVWDTPGVVRMGGIGGHCACFPNIPSRLGRWSERYEGDYDFIASTLALWGDTAPLFVDRLISRARP